MSQLGPIIPWYRTRAGAIFLAILGAIFLFVLGFSGLIGYYGLKIKLGKGQELAKTFSQQFTLDPAKRNLVQTNTIAQNPLKFIRDHTPTLGEINAPVTILAFIDFECPFSQAGWPTFQEVTERYGPAIRVAFKHLPVPAIHPQALNAHLAAACAQEQNKFWEYYNRLFTDKRLDPTSLLQYAEEAGINLNQFKTCFADKKYQPAIQQDLIDASKLGIRGTPTYIVNQLKLEGIAPLAVWNKVILTELQKK